MIGIRCLPFVLAVVALSTGLATFAQAGIYADDLSKCVVEATSKDDRISLVKWIFEAMSRYPAVTSLTTIKDSDLEQANATTGALFMRLLTETCVDASRKAIKYEGPVAIQLSFQVLGQVAMAEIMSDPSVAKVMAGLEKYTDQKKIAALKE